jgi:hypothetical protein
MTPVKLPGVPDETQTGVLDLSELGIGQVPIVELRWHDERTGCKLAHYYLAHEVQGTPAEYGACHFYQAGRCKMNGCESGRPRSACLFHEAEDGQSWRRVKGWRLLEEPDGTLFLTPARSAAEMAANFGARIVGAPAEVIPA